MSLHVVLPLSAPLQKPMKAFKSGQHKAKQTEGPRGKVCVEGLAERGNYCLEYKNSPHQVGPTVLASCLKTCGWVSSPKQEGWKAEGLENQNVLGHQKAAPYCFGARGESRSTEAVARHRAERYS